MAEKKNSDSESLAGREIRSARTMPVPRERVWEALSDPAQLAQWWGPKGFTNTFQEFTLQPGGRWKLVMHGPDGKDYQTDKVVVEVAQPERLTLRHEQSGHNFSLTIKFADVAGRTHVTWHMVFDTVAECAPVKSIIVEANEQSFDRLEAHLAKPVSGRTGVVR